MKSTLLLRNAIKNVQQMIKHDLNILEVDRYRITVKAGTGGAGIPRRVFFTFTKFLFEHKYMSSVVCELRLVSAGGFCLWFYEFLFLIQIQWDWRQRRERVHAVA